MRGLLTRVVTSAAVTYAAAPLVRRAMVAAGTLDVPNHRSSHTTPVPRGGGLACLAGVGAALAVAPPVVPARDVLAVVGLAAVGLVDDRTGGLPPAPRLAAQTLAGVACGARHHPVAALGGAVLVPGVVNVVNFMDGINGISGSTALVWGTLALAGAEYPLPVRALGAAAAGAGLGFLPHNVPQADLFLGDVGSYLLGGLMGVALVETLTTPSRTLRLGAPLLPYAADAAQALVRRARRGDPLFEAHREHVYQRLVDGHGVSHTWMSAAHAATALTVGLLARSRHRVVAVGASATVLAAYVAAPAVLQRLRPLRSRAPQHPHDASAAEEHRTPSDERRPDRPRQAHKPRHAQGVSV